MKKSILVIPHIPFEKIRVRGKEIAREFGKTCGVHFLTWTTSHSQNIYQRIKNMFKDISKRSTTFKEGSITVEKLERLIEQTNPPTRGIINEDIVGTSTCQVHPWSQ